MTVRDLGDNDYDVVIVGGGPAGLSAGVRCANEGVKTLLVEATDILLPKRSWLVESIAGVEKLKTLGIDETEIATNWVDQFRLTSIHDDSIITARAGFREGFKNIDVAPFGKGIAGYYMPQDKMAKHLIDRSDGLEIRDKTRVVDVRRKDGYAAAKLSNGNIVKTKILIDASGALREPSRMLGRAWNPKLIWTAYGYTLKVKNLQLLDMDPHEFICEWGPYVPGAEIQCLWNDPISDDTLDFVVYTATDVTKKNPFPNGIPPLGMDEREHCKQYIMPIYRTFENKYKNAIKDSKVVREIYGMRYWNWETKPYDDNLLIAGEAGGQTTFWLGGHIQSLIYGWDAGSAAIESIAQEDYSRKFLKRYYKLLERDCLYNMSVFSFVSIFGTRTSGFFSDVFSDENNYLYQHLKEEEYKEFVRIGHKALTDSRFTFKEWTRFLNML
jgi:Dehydrogenases (flavoproteins)